MRPILVILRHCYKTQSRDMAKRDINSIRIIHSFALEKGMDSESLLRGTRIEAIQLSDSESLIDDEQELHVLQNLLDYFGDPFWLGVELGLRYQLTSYGIVGYALLSSETLRKASVLGMRYLALTYAFSDIRLNEQDDQFFLTFHTEIQDELGVLVMIRDIWAVSIIYKELFALDQVPFTLELCIDEPMYKPEVAPTALEISVGGNIVFGASRNAYIGASNLLDLPLPKANDLTARLCEAQCLELLQKKQAWQGLSQQVREILLRDGLDTSMESIANVLARTTRTLHRQLKEEGTTWRQLRDNVRTGLAEELLAQPIQLDEIAERLGYSDVTNFSHSFKRCKGCSPGFYRKQKGLVSF